MLYYKRVGKLYTATHLGCSNATPMDAVSLGRGMTSAWPLVLLVGNHWLFFFGGGSIVEPPFYFRFLLTNTHVSVIIPAETFVAI